MKKTSYLMSLQVPINKEGNENWRQQARASVDYAMDRLMDAPEEDWKLTEIPEGKAAWVFTELKDE